MGRKRLHGGIADIIRYKQAPMACTDETFVARRRKPSEHNGACFHHKGLGQRVYGRRDLEAKMAAHGARPADDSEGGYTP